MSERRGGYQRSFSGLVGAMMAALLVIVFVWGLTRFQHRDVADPVTTVDYSGALATAREQAPFEVVAPEPAPQGWRATSVDWNGVGSEVEWHLGFLTGPGSDADYVGLEQGNAPAAEFTKAVTTADVPGGPVDVAGLAWASLTSNDGDETALVQTTDGVTIVVTGTAPVDELVAFAASLSTT